MKLWLMMEYGICILSKSQWTNTLEPWICLVIFKTEKGSFSSVRMDCKGKIKACIAHEAIVIVYCMFLIFQDKCFDSYFYFCSAWSKLAYTTHPPPPPPQTFGLVTGIIVSCINFLQIYKYSLLLRLNLRSQPTRVKTPNQLGYKLFTRIG
jgi:uncharacterized membrane protein